MNHDYAHCADFDKSCPRSCFRAALTEEYREKHLNFPVPWSHLRDTDDCILNHKKQTNGDNIRSMTDEAIAIFIANLLVDTFKLCGKKTSYLQQFAAWKKWLKNTVEDMQ